MYSTASVACKNWNPDTTSGTYLPQNTREASYAIFPIVYFHEYINDILHNFGEIGGKQQSGAAPCMKISKPNVFRQDFWQDFCFRENNC